jgi:hypothetical protein
MKSEDLKEMADRCRLLAGNADSFTRKRLTDLALKYEARAEGRSVASKMLGRSLPSMQAKKTGEAII